MKAYKLGEVCELSKGKTITRATTSAGEIPVIGGGLGPTYYHNVANRKSPVITISASGANAGYVNLWEVPIWASDCTTIVEKAGSPATLGYVYKYLQSRQEYINSKLRRGSAQPHVYLSDIAELEISLPSLDEQRQIVVKLDSMFSQIEELRIKTIEQRKGVSLLALSSIQKLLADPSVDTITVTIDQISENLDNQRIPITRDVRIGGTYPYYGASGIIDYVEKYIFEGNALLVSEDGANLLARSTPIAFSVSGKYWVNNHAHVLKFQDPHLQRYVEYVLENTKLDPYITGAAQPKLTQRALNTIPIRIPKKTEDLLMVTEKITNLNHLSALSLAKFDAKLDLINELKLSILGENFELEAS